MRIAVVLPFALALALVFAVPVSAAPPVVETGEIEEQWVSELCPELTVINHAIWTYRETKYYDNDGNLTRHYTHWAGFDEFWNIENPDFVLKGTYSMHWTFDASKGEEKVTGSIYSITLPGSGKVLKGAGLRNLTTGKRVGVVLDPESIAEFCAVMAGE